MAAQPWREQLRENVRRVRERIAATCRRTGRPADSVRLIGVTKYVSLDVLHALTAEDVADLAENRVQQLLARAAACGAARLDWPEDQSAATGADPAWPRWHMIGHVQRNKVKALLDRVRIIHSLDSQRLAQAVEHHAALGDVTVDVFIEVNVAGELSKQGIPPAELTPLVGTVSRCPHLRLRGLMTMAPYSPEPEASRPHFESLRRLLEGLRQRGEVGPHCRHLSMGMSQDYEVAVEEGATFVRIGAALYENLPTDDPRDSS